ncbi:MAG: hypothetical protein WCG25_07700 [bacterium]
MIILTFSPSLLLSLHLPSYSFHDLSPFAQTSLVGVHPPHHQPHQPPPPHHQPPHHHVGAGV